MLTRHGKKSGAQRPITYHRTAATDAVAGRHANYITILLAFQRIVLATEETTMTERVSRRHIKIKCQPCSWSHHGDNPTRYSNQQGSKSRQNHPNHRIYLFAVHGFSESQSKHHLYCEQEKPAHCHGSLLLRLGTHQIQNRTRDAHKSTHTVL